MPETITAVGGGLKNLSDIGLFAVEPGAKSSVAKECKAHADIYDIENGKLVNPQQFRAAQISRIIHAPPSKSAKEVAAEILKSCKAAVAGEPTGLPPAIAAAFIQDCKDHI